MEALAFIGICIAIFVIATIFALKRRNDVRFLSKKKKRELEGRAPKLNLLADKPGRDQKYWADKLDRLVSKIIRHRDPVCRVCGKPQTYHHHIFSRRYWGTRWDIKNGVGLCWHCHEFYAHSQSQAFDDWVVSWMGRAKYDTLKAKALAPCKKPKAFEMELIFREFSEKYSSDGSPK